MLSLAEKHIFMAYFRTSKIQQWWHKYHKSSTTSIDSQIILIKTWFNFADIYRGWRKWFQDKSAFLGDSFRDKKFPLLLIDHKPCSNIPIYWPGPINSLDSSKYKYIYITRPFCESNIGFWNCSVHWNDFQKKFNGTLKFGNDFYQWLNFFFFFLWPTMTKR